MKSHTEANRIRPDILTAAVYFSVIVMMIYVIICQRIFGDKGAFFSAGPCFAYFTCYMGIVLAAQKAVYVMVRLRARRSQYYNAEANMIKSIRFLAIGAVLIGALIILLSLKFAGVLLGAERGFFQLAIAGAAILFLGGQGVIRGYLQGIGYTRPIFISDILVSMISLIVGTVAVEILYSYGVRVNDLFHISEFSAVYGSCGMMIGLFAGAFAGFIQTFVSFHLRKAEIADFVKSGAPKYLDNKNDVIAGIRPHLLLYISLPLMALIDQIFYVAYARKPDTQIDYMTQFGVYAGRILPSVVLISVLCCIFYIKRWNRIMARFERDELEGARERYKNTLRFFNMLVMPVTAFVFAVPSTVQAVLYGKTGSLSDKLMMPAAAGIFLLSFAIMHSWLIGHMGKSLVIILNTAVAFVVHIAGLVLFVLVLHLGIYALVYSTILSLAVYDVLSFFMIRKVLNFRMDPRRTIIFPLVSSIIAGFVVFLLDKLFVGLIGEILTFLICAVICWIIFMLAMIATRTIRYHELKNVPLGGLFMGVSVMLGNGNHEEE